MSDQRRRARYLGEPSEALDFESSVCRGTQLWLGIQATSRGGVS